MANENHLKTLIQGTEAWNALRTETDPDTWLDLSAAELPGVDIRGADLSRTDLRDANLAGARLARAQLIAADLRGANLQGANLELAQMDWADLRGANLRRANLAYIWETHVNLSGVDLREASLARARLQHSDMSHTNLSGANLTLVDLRDITLDHACLNGANLLDATLRRIRFAGTQFLEARVGHTAFIDVDLREALNLDKCRHTHPSSVDHRTIATSGALPVAFLRGCGLSDWEIETASLYKVSLSTQEFSDIGLRIIDLRENRHLQRHNVFISYSRADSHFVDVLEGRLDDEGIRFWRDVHDALAGRLDRNVEHGMRSNPIVVIVLSRDSVRSDWVEHEVSLATRLSKELSRDVLCPIALDESWKTCDWNGPVRTQLMKYNILDFSQWEIPQEFDRLFRRLVKGLDLFYSS